MKLRARRILAFSAAVGVVIYSLVVLDTVATSRDLGIRCLFTSDEQSLPAGMSGIEVRQVQSHLEVFGHGMRPQAGDILLTVGGEPMPSFVYFTRQLRKLHTMPVPSGGALAAGADPTEKTNIPPVVEIGGDRVTRWAKVEFYRPDLSLPEGERRKEVWCAIARPVTDTLLLSFLWFLMEMFIFVLGAVVYWKRPGNESARLFFAVCILTVGAFMGGYHWLSIAGTGWMLYPFAVCAILVPPVLLHFYLVFPRTKTILRRHPWLTRAGMYGIPGLWMAAILGAMFWVDWLEWFDHAPDEINWALVLLRQGVFSYLVVAAALFVASLVSLVHSLVTSRSQVERSQVTWILTAAMLATVPLGYTLYLAADDPPGFVLGRATFPMFVSSVLFMLGYAVSFFRDKYQLDTAMQRMSQAVSKLVDADTLAERMLESACEALGAEWGAIYLRPEGRAALKRTAVKGTGDGPEWLDWDDALVSAAAEPSSVLVPRGLTGQLGPAQRQLRDLGFELAYPMEGDGEVLGLVLLGPKPGMAGYGPEDLTFLAALARIAALALRNVAGHRTIEHLTGRIGEQERRIQLLQAELMKGHPLAEPAETGPFDRGEIRGSSPAVQQMLEVVRKVARSESAVLIRGESGTGKELLARAIHLNSPRSTGPFVAVHCAALSSGLLESELFGHVKGAFTGAYRDKAGRFEMADRGTLFLDEIGDINLETQTRLLRVLQEMAFERVGGTETIHVDVRIIAATHQNLERLIETGRFREDLYYRLNVISIHTPPLRERSDDIFELALHFLALYGSKMGKRITGIDDDALVALVHYRWPGNVRELENVIERAVVLGDGPTLTSAELPPPLVAEDGTGGPREAPRWRTSPASAAVGWSGPARRTTTSDAFQVTTADGQERRRLTEAMGQAAGNKAEAARLLGLPRSTFFSKLKKHGLL